MLLINHVGRGRLQALQYLEKTQHHDRWGDLKEFMYCQYRQLGFEK